MSKSVASIQKTKNYGMFFYDNENRGVNLKGSVRKTLRTSMQKYGWIPGAPMMAKRIGGKMIIKDGQHRFAIAKELGLEVPFIVISEDVEPSLFNGGGRVWSNDDYVTSFAAKGKDDYIELREFSSEHNIPMNCASVLLGGGNHQAIRRGSWRITNRKQAEDVMSIYSQLCEVNDDVGVRSLIGALHAIAHVKSIDMRRLVVAAKRHPKMLHRVSNRDDALIMLEDLYNYGKHQKDPIKMMAENALRSKMLVKHPVNAVA